MQEKPRPAVELVAEISPELSQIIEKSLEKMPEARFQTAEEFHAALGGLNGSQPKSAATGIVGCRAIADTPVPRSSLSVLDEPARSDSTPPPGKVSDTGSKSWDPALLENARKNLAVYVGPMAKVLVGRAAKNARTLEDLYHALAAEVTAPADREKFLRSKPP
jgi:eukaryotic-like serine/threonine-protein kinase